MKTGMTSGSLLIALLLGLAVAMGGVALESPATPPRSDSHGQVAPADSAANLGTILPSRLPIPPATPAPPDVAAEAHVQAALGKLPLYFIENRGQLDERVGYYLQGRDTTIYFTADGVTFALTGPAPDAAKPPRHPASVRPVALESEPDSAGARQRWALKLEFLGANPNVNPVGQSPTPAVVSYFKGPREAWKAGLPTYASVVYPDLWPGIDLVYSGTAGRLKYTFLVKPGADPQQIKLAYRGATAVRPTETGDLAVSTPVGDFHDEKPVSYQEVNGQRVEVATAYALEAEVVSGEHAYGFRLGAYDASRPLVLDPAVIVYAGYIGGAGGDPATGIAVDGAGNAYVTGTTNSFEGTFPVLVGPDLTFNGGLDVFVAKVRADGTGLVYAGYIGGAGTDRPAGIAVDGAGNAYVTGWTDSTEATFPVLVGPDLTHNGRADAFVAKVRADGTGLVYAGYIGGAGDDSGGGIAVDGAGNAYVTGATNSFEGTFPVLVGPDLTYNGGFGDTFVAKVRADGTGLVYAGYIGGASDDIGYGIAVDGAGNAYVTGWTNSSEATFPVLVGPDLTYNGNSDAFVAKVRADGTGLVYAGYIGGASDDIGQGIAVDGAGNAYVTGYTYSTDFPVRVGPDLIYNGGADAFVAKVRADGTGLVYAGYIGGAGDDLGTGIAVDGAGNAYVAGWTNSSEATFPVLVGPDLTFNGFTDAFVAKISAQAGQLPVPVVLMHGWCGSPDDFNQTGQLLAQDLNVPVSKFDYSDLSGIPDLERLLLVELAGKFAKHVQDLKDKLGVEKVDVVAHSMGGLITRAWIAGLAFDETHHRVPYNNEIRRLIMAATPQYGSTLALLGWIPRHFNKNCGRDNPRNSQADQMVFGSGFLKDLHEAWTRYQQPPIAPENVLLLVGCTSFHFGSTGPCFTDWAVYAESAALPDYATTVRYVAKDHITANLGSIGILKGIVDVDNPGHPTYQAVKMFLATGQVPPQGNLGFTPNEIPGMFIVRLVNPDGTPFTDFSDADPVKFPIRTCNGVVRTRPLFFNPGDRTGMFTLTGVPAPLGQTTCYQVKIKVPRSYRPPGVFEEGIVAGRPTVPDPITISPKALRLGRPGRPR